MDDEKEKPEGDPDNEAEKAPDPKNEPDDKNLPTDTGKPMKWGTGKWGDEWG